MTTKIDERMMNEPYIRHVIEELEKLGYTNAYAISTLKRYFDIIQRSMGFNPNAWEFAAEVDRLHKGSHKKYDPDDPSLIDVTEFRKRVSAKLMKRQWALDIRSIRNDVNEATGSMEWIKDISLLDSVEYMKDNQKNCYYCASEMTVRPAVARFIQDVYVGDLPHYVCNLCDEISKTLHVGLAAERLIIKHGFKGTVYLKQLLKAEEEDAKHERNEG